MPQTGVPFHGEFSSADASAPTEPNARFALYGAGTKTAITLGTTDSVSVTDIVFVNTAVGALGVKVYDGADNVPDAGELIVNTTAPATTGQQSVRFATPHICQIGTYPKVKATGAGQVDLLIHGTISRGGS